MGFLTTASGVGAAIGPASLAHSVDRSHRTCGALVTVTVSVNVEAVQHQ